MPDNFQDTSNIKSIRGRNNEWFFRKFVLYSLKIEIKYGNKAISANFHKIWRDKK